MQLKLEIFVDGNCPNCIQALQNAKLVEERLPEVMVRVIDLKTTSEKPDSVFAVPTYILNGKTFSLGNPDEAILLARLEADLRTH